MKRLGFLFSLVFTGSQYVLPELHLSLPAAIDLSPPLVDVGLQLTGLGFCFLEGVASCQSLGRVR